MIGPDSRAMREAKYQWLTFRFMRTAGLMLGLLEMMAFVLLPKIKHAFPLIRSTTRSLPLVVLGCIFL